MSNSLWSHGLTAAHQAPVHGVFPAILEWDTMPSSRGYFWPRDQTCISCIAAAAAAAAKSLQSCPTLCDPIDGSPPGSPIPGILQARTLEWVAISFSKAWKWKVKVKSLKSCLTLCNSMDCSLPGSSVHGIFQARIHGLFTDEPPGKPVICMWILFSHEKEWSSDMCYNVDQPWKHYAKWNMPYKGQIL